MKKSKISERQVATAFARSWNTLDPSHFAQYLGPATRHHSQWVFDVMTGREQIISYLMSKMGAVKNAKAQGARISAELCATRKGPFVFSSGRTPRALAQAKQLEEKLQAALDSFCVLITQELSKGQKNEALVVFQVENEMLTRYCYCMPELYRHRRLGITPGVE